MTSRPAWQNWSTVALRAALGAGLLAACFALPDMSALPAAFSRMHPAWLALAFVLAVVGTVLLPALVTKEALAVERIDLTFAELVRINFESRFYVIVLPRPASVGIRWLRYAKGGDPHDALALMAYERLVQILVMTLIGTVVLAFELARLGPAAAGVLAASAACTAALAALLLPFLVPAVARRLLAWLQAGSRMLPAFLATRMRRLLEAVQAYDRLGRRSTARILAYSILSYALFIASPYAVAVAMNADISVPALAWIRPLVFLLTLLPFTMGGMGVREAGFIGLLGLYGVAAPTALAFSLTLFAIQVAIGLVGLALALARRRTDRRAVAP